MQNWQTDLLAEQQRYRVLLDKHQLRCVQFASSNILIEAFAAGTLWCVAACSVDAPLLTKPRSTMNDEALRRRAEAHLGGSTNTLDSAQAHFVVSQT